MIFEHHWSKSKIELALKSSLYTSWPTSKWCLAQLNSHDNNFRYESPPTPWPNILPHQRILDKNAASFTDIFVIIFDIIIIIIFIISDTRPTCHVVQYIVPSPGGPQSCRHGGSKTQSGPWSTLAGRPGTFRNNFICKGPFWRFFLFQCIDAGWKYSTILGA